MAATVHEAGTRDGCHTRQPWARPSAGSRGHLPVCLSSSRAEISGMFVVAAKGGQYGYLGPRSSKALRLVLRRDAGMQPRLSPCLLFAGNPWLVASRL